MLTFSQIVGLESAKQALLLLAVDSTLGGVAISAKVGSGKSALARAFASLVPNTPFVELPLNATEDRLIGGLDLEATLTSGERVIEKGLLARANDGVLYVDSINLLDTTAMTAIMQAMSSGVVRVEREGLSATHDARFVLIGTYDTSEGDVRKGLLDRIGLIVPMTANCDMHFRAEVVRANENRETISKKSESKNRTTDEERLLREMIFAGRLLLPRVNISDEQVAGIAKAAQALGVEGNRADVFAAQAAMANAALGGRTEVDDEDLELAARLVLMPRATRLPEVETKDEQTTEDKRPKTVEDNHDDESAENNSQQPDIQELMLSAIETELPSDILNLPFAAQRRAGSGSRGEALNARRGRFVRAVEGSPRGNRIAVLQTLMAAAPWQKSRSLKQEQRTKDEMRTNKANGAHRASFVESHTRVVYPAPNDHRPLSLVIKKSDLRVKRYRDKSGALFVFVVDASGSMALNRMREAKGAVARLLQSAYVHRDRVALIAFKGKSAQVLLPMSQSVERAKREMDVLPTGGGTPLASALLTAWQTAQQARAQGISQSIFVLMTDGRGNVALNDERVSSSIEDELRQIASLIRADGVQSIVIDTQANYLSRGEAPKLAGWLGGKYVYLPNAKAEQIAQVVSR
jgi:magnesium chelatase subunit D